jgi:hypothetical protein
MYNRFQEELLRFIAVALKRYYYFICHPERSEGSPLLMPFKRNKEKEKILYRL